MFGSHGVSHEFVVRLFVGSFLFFGARLAWRNFVLGTRKCGAPSFQKLGCFSRNNSTLPVTSFIYMGFISLLTCANPSELNALRLSLSRELQELTILHTFRVYVMCGYMTPRMRSQLCCHVRKIYDVPSRAFYPQVHDIKITEIRMRSFLLLFFSYTSVLSHHTRTNQK